ncbi:J domain-containing protein [Calothrix sp. UHCC 0171]|uniref:J domain-containing protein n=1 Tax=Calothrix sp. UHCC 0171 TaxID=3110245 RepID=UPI002B1F5411|nr:J domain-containing protein [Calothrix sp. UHCC 0171]MEA5569962.1 J domain-containing protein [Calothrix sp. UHCC 0171]
MPRTKTAPNKRATATTLAPSELHLRMEGLEVEHQKLLKQIKKKRKELDNFIEQMRSIATEIFGRATPNYQKMAQIDQEIHSLFREILEKKKLGKQSKRKIEEIYRSLQHAGIISHKAFQIFDDQDLEEELENLEEEFGVDSEEFKSQRSQHHYYYHRPDSEVESPSAIRSESSKKIRHIFLRLAEIFHPDRAKDNDTQKRHTEIMQEINKAYQEGDLARLLEIEQQYEVGEEIDSNSQDDLSRKCSRLEQNNKILKNQYESLKKELREVKKTPEGEMLADCKKAKKHGVDPVDEILGQLESQIEVVSEIRDYVKDFREKKLTIKEFLEGPEVLRSLQRDMMEELLEEMLEEFGGAIRF